MFLSLEFEVRDSESRSDFFWTFIPYYFFIGKSVFCDL
ncbi:hypothetical protein BCO_0900011 [Borrelia coriaceae ATCC 43381]|uniref:Uncharacterized protein n=1 Tax=Borrelia coriaceae ATCC 43381 TaxID=1408429 RepID=W5SVX9_9SPIR|nr:hypothetical protein BCO_0900011 [Borrelia coriaceae ATCC 43381]